MTQWYEELFTNYAATYDKEVFTQGTLQETDFLEQELNFDTRRVQLKIKSLIIKQIVMEDCQTSY